MAERTRRRSKTAERPDDAALQIRPANEVLVPRRRAVVSEISEGERSVAAVLQFEENVLDVLSSYSEMSDEKGGLQGSRRMLEAVGNMFLSPRDRFRKSERGYERPESVFRTRREAYAHFRRECERAGVRLERSHRRPSRSDISQIESLGEEVANNYLTSEFLGPLIYSRFHSSPPRVTIHDDASYDRLDRADGNTFPTYGNGSTARYHPDTNHITMRESILDQDEANQIETMVHEQLHYAAWLGGGLDNIRWVDEHGEPVVRDQVDWLHEGLTELQSNQITRSHGHEPTSTAYPYETAVAFYMQRIVGEGTLREAYLTGNFTEVRRRFDARLGAGSFDRLASMSRGWQALSFIMPLMAENNIDFTRWERDPVLASCFGHIAAIDEGGGGW